jgi:hypothetical protein
MKLLKKFKKLFTFSNKAKATEQELREPHLYQIIPKETHMTQTVSKTTQTQDEKIICPTCECLPEKETLTLKQIRINQQLDDTTANAIVLPYYSLVPPFHVFDDEPKNSGESGTTTTGEFSNRRYLGAMSNKKGKAAVKKLYLSVYGTIEYVDKDQDVVLLKPLADYDKEGNVKKPCVTGLELLVAASNLLKEEGEGKGEKETILGKRFLNDLLGKTLTYLFEGRERLEGIPCSFIEENTACYDDQLNRIAIENMQGKLVVGIVDYCLYDGGKNTSVGLHFVRVLGEDEKKKVMDIVHKYYYG